MSAPTSHDAFRLTSAADAPAANDEVDGHASEVSGRCDLVCAVTDTEHEGHDHTRSLDVALVHQLQYHARCSSGGPPRTRAARSAVGTVTVRMKWVSQRVFNT